MSVFAALYDPVLWLTEASFLSAARSALLADLRGRVLEIGAGTGLNLPHYPPGITLVLTEPSAGMRARLAARTSAEVAPCGAEALPFPDASFDEAVSTLVLCSVRDPDRALSEIRRVLAPGGRLRFLEHVASDHPLTGPVQRALDPLWAPLAGGCHLCRDTVGAIGRAGFTLEAVEPAWPWSVPPFLRPFVRGTAIR